MTCHSIINKQRNLWLNQQHTYAMMLKIQKEKKETNVSINVFGGDLLKYKFM